MKHIEPLKDMQESWFNKINELVHSVNSLLPEPMDEPVSPTNLPVAQERLADVLRKRVGPIDVGIFLMNESLYPTLANAAIEFILKKICDAGLYCPQLETLLNQMKS